MISKRPTKPVCYVVAILVLAWTAPAAAQRLRVSGELRTVDFFSSEGISDVEAGSFVWDSSGAGLDVRSHPGTLTWTTPGGSLVAATLVKVNEARRVDPDSARLVAASAAPGASCSTGSEAGCWDPAAPDDPGNLAAFDAICRASVGFNSFDPSACTVDIFNSRAIVSFTPITEIFSNLIGGQGTLSSGLNAGTIFELIAALVPGTNGQSGNPGSSYPGLVALAGPDGYQGTPDDPFPFMQAFAPGVFGLPVDITGDGVNDDFMPSCGPSALASGRCLPLPLVPLSIDADDGFTGAPPPGVTGFFGLTTAAPLLTDEQEAHLGCGDLLGTSCDVDGIGLFRSELSALIAQLPAEDLEERACLRDESGTATVLAGCRGPADAGYSADRDGSLGGPVLQSAAGNITGPYFGGFDPGTAAQSALGPPGADVEGRFHPFTGEPFASEMDALSHNLITSLAPQTPSFDGTDPLRPGSCSLLEPERCEPVAGFANLSTIELPDDPSGAPRRRWVWETGAQLVVTEATGDLAGFLGWDVHAFGPEVSRVDGTEAGVAFLLEPPDGAAEPGSDFVVSFPGMDGLEGTADDPFQGLAYGVAANDGDGDGVPDDADNCTELSNPGQEDANAGADDDSTLAGVQSYGDACDVDLDDDGIVAASDFFNVFRPCLGADTTIRPECAIADCDADGGVAASDFFDCFRPALGTAPGPGTTE